MPASVSHWWRFVCDQLRLGFGAWVGRGQRPPRRGRIGCALLTHRSRWSARVAWPWRTQCCGRGCLRSALSSCSCTSAAPKLGARQGAKARRKTCPFSVQMWAGKRRGRRQHKLSAGSADGMDGERLEQARLLRRPAVLLCWCRALWACRLRSRTEPMEWAGGRSSIPASGTRQSSAAFARRSSAAAATNGVEYMQQDAWSTMHSMACDAWDRDGVHGAVQQLRRDCMETQLGRTCTVVHGGMLRCGGGG